MNILRFLPRRSILNLSESEVKDGSRARCPAVLLPERSRILPQSKSGHRTLFAPGVRTGGPPFQIFLNPEYNYQAAGAIINPPNNSANFPQQNTWGDL